LVRSKDARRKVEAILEIVLSTFRTAFNSVKWFIRRVPKIIWMWIAAVTLVMVVSAATTLVVLMIVDSPSLPRGGIDLQRYCETYGYAQLEMKANRDAVCSSMVNLDEACDWEYRSTGLRLELKDPANPYSGVCLDREKRPKGGISNMVGYCKSKAGTGSPAAVVQDNIWTCQLKVVMNVACSWQYAEEGLTAKLEENEWMCYG
jgi:hypothetical protein